MVNEHVQKMLILCLYGNRVKMTTPTGTAQPMARTAANVGEDIENREPSTTRWKQQQFPRKRTRQELKSL